MTEIEKAVEAGMNAIHWNDFDPYHSGQPVEIEKGITAGIRAFAQGVGMDLTKEARDAGWGGYRVGMQDAAVIVRILAGIGGE